jgi:protein-tyrosine phosphatase
LIDLHCHVLPGIDDGARDLEDAIAMARQAEADGIEVVCATPHIRHDHDVRIHELDERIAQLQQALDAAGVAVRVERGGEVAEPILDALTDDELRTVALGARWVLLEPAPGPLGEALIAGVAELKARGFRTIVAHPERHPADDIEDRLSQAVAGGALVQATAAALAEGGDGAEWLTRLAQDGLIHVLGSDAHTSHFGRRVELSAAFARLGSAGADAAAMRTRAEAVIAGSGHMSAAAARADASPADRAQLGARMRRGSA